MTFHEAAHLSADLTPTTSPEYDLRRRAIMRFDPTSEGVDDPRSMERELWKDGRQPRRTEEPVGLLPCEIADRRNPMLKWIFVALLALQAHFAASYLVPLDDQAQRSFGGLLRWAWRWAIGDGGPLGRVTPSGFPVARFFLAVTAAGVLIAAALAVARLSVPFDCWRWLAISGAVLSLLLMAAFVGPTKLLPITTGLAIIAAALGYWPAVTRVL